jgi:multicomponent Na+:H+ antiporter subunit E
MRALLWNLVLALTWGAMTGSFEVDNLLVGFAIGFVVMYVAERRTGEARYVRRVVAIVKFIGFYLWELVVANLRVAYDVITPGRRSTPGILAVPLDATTDAEITLVANLLTMTPGDLSIDVSSDRSVLYIHSLYIDDPEKVRRNIKRGFERRVLEMMR